LDIDWLYALAELAANPKLRIWRLNEEVQKHLRPITATHNKHEPTNEQMRGNLRACIPLGFRFTSEANTHHIFLGVRMSGYQVDGVLHKSGRVLHRTAPGTQNRTINKDCFLPVNDVLAWEYKKLKACTIDDLHEDVQAIDATARKPAQGFVAVGSLAHATLIDALNRGEYADMIEAQQMDAARIMSPHASDATLPVPYDTAKDLIQFLEPQIKERSRGLWDLTQLGLELCRADGEESFISPKGIHGQVIGDQHIGSLDSEEGKKSVLLNNEELRTRKLYYLAGEFEYQLMADGSDFRNV
jgi:hypothetical protein